MWGNQSYQGPMSEWLMVAEKPAIAKAIADALSSNGRHTKERSPVENCNIPVYTFDTQQLGHLGPARVRVTSTVGHIYGLDFSGPYRKWGCDPADLFYAPTEKIFAGDAPVKEHLETVAASCNMLMLWLDCDREGENICFEVMDAVLPRMKPDYSDNDRIWRSRFSSLAPQDLRNALQSLVKPDQMQSQSVDARQVIDLKVGVALTRLLTGGLRESARGLVPETGTRGPLISYGPCQGPTLGFVVNRYEEIMRFQTEKSSTLDLHVMNAVAFWRSKPNREGLHVHSERHLLEEWANNCSEVRILGNNRPREERLERPVALNTVAMLKAASIELGFDPHYALECAEKLYLQGALTYPRTESTHYPPAQDLRWLVSQFVGHPEVGWWAQELQTRFTDPQWGYDAGDHPPIMPVKYANVDGDLGKLYVMVVRHFLASVSPDLLYRRHDAKFEAHGEKFALSGQELFDKGWANIVTCKQKFLTPAQVELCTAPAQTIQCWATLRQVKTSPPQLLTEADLLSLMESNEVGTDASMSTHIKNISTRGYVEILNGRKMRPTHLGCQLIAGLRECDPELVNPEVRARIERDVLQVARGQQTQEQVVNDALEIFSAKFQEVRRNLRRIEQLIRMPPRPLVGGDHMENQPGYGKGGFGDGNWQPGAYDKGGFGKGGKNDGKGRPGPYDKGGFGGKGGFRDKGGFDDKGGFGNQGGFGGKGGFGDKGGFGGKGGYCDKGGFGGKGGHGDKGGYGKGGGGGYNNTGGYGKGGGGGYNDSGGFGKGFNNGYNDNKGGFAKGGNGKGSGYNNDKGYGGRKGGVGKSSSGKGYGDQSKGGYGAGYGSNAGGGNGSAWPPPPQARSAPYNSAGGGFGQYGAGAWTGDAGEGTTGNWIGDAGQAATGGWTEESGQVATSGWTGEAGQAAMGDWAGDADAYGGGEKNVSLAQEKAEYQGGMQGMRPVPGRQESATLASMSGGIAGMRRIGT